MSKKNQRVFVAMSGGVDSSVAAALLKEQGYEVVGVTMCFNISYPEKKKPSCCGAEGIQDARRVAQILDIPHHVLNFGADINDFIIEDFAQEYLQGRTPNPCVRCNQYLKFGTLYEKVMTLDADYLATGHYSRIIQDSDSGKYVIQKAEDAIKDQSYFLYGIKREILPRLLFPLGDLTKGQVRELAQQFGLNTAEKPESQDICFVPDSGYKQFIRDLKGDKDFVPGPFKNQDGEEVGQHAGIANYTIGQRDKLGIALGQPVYVYKIEKETNTVFVGPKECLLSDGLVARQFNVVSMDELKGPTDVRVRIRYNAAEVDGVLSPMEGDSVRVDFKEPQKAVTPGQSVVFYDGEVLLGGAVIEEARGNNDGVAS